MDVPAYKAALTRVCVASRELPIDVRKHPSLCRDKEIPDFCRFAALVDNMHAPERMAMLDRVGFMLERAGLAVTGPGDVGNCL